MKFCFWLDEENVEQIKLLLDYVINRSNNVTIVLYSINKSISLGEVRKHIKTFFQDFFVLGVYSKDMSTC